MKTLSIVFSIKKSISVLFEKFFWHFCKVMPAEMILKQKWSVYHIIEREYYGHGFDLCFLNGQENNSKKNIWFYWNTGIDNAPTIVQACYRSLLKHIPDGWTVVTLTEESAKEYVKLPHFIENLKSSGKMWYALYSDLVRLALLYEYGGIWCDATCYLTQPIPASVLDSQLFMFSYEGLLNALPSKFENWFIKAEKGNYVIGGILQDLLYYWSQPKKKQEYFVWFHLQTALYNHDLKAKAMMDQIPYFYNYDAMLVHIHYGFDYMYSDDLWRQIEQKCFVQKLTYKYDESFESGNTLIHHILNSNT